MTTKQRIEAFRRAILVLSLGWENAVTLMKKERARDDEAQSDDSAAV